MEFEKDCWYWMFNPEEGGIFYPIYINSDGRVVMDGKIMDESPQDLPLERAEMPNFVR